MRPAPRRATAHAVLAAACALLACTGSDADTAADSAGASPPAAAAASVAPPAWSRDAAIYEVNVRQYTPEGTFAALLPHLPRLDSLGVDILWLMPVQPIGEQNRKGPLGSYYSIRDYTAVNPAHGTPADFRRLTDSAHALGLRVILDWVANHTAFDHAWTTEHPDWYTRRADGSISHPLGEDGKETDWTDVAELNYDDAEMRRAMLGEMRWWIDSMGVDGFRADVAWGVPADFWASVRQEMTAAKPDVFLLAEAEGPQYHASFHMTYGWSLHHLLNDVAKGEAPTDSLAAWVARDDSLYPADAYRMHFTSNHDENSWQGTEFERMGANHLPAFVVAATVERSMPLLYTGQEASFNRRLKFFERDPVDWSGPSLADFYGTIFELKRTQRALHNGAAGGDQRPLAHDGGDRVYAFTRTEGDNTVVVAVNFADAPATVAYRALPRPGTYTDWFSKTAEQLSANGTLDVPAHGYRVLVR